MQTDDHFRGPLNLGNSNECSIKHLADRIICLANSKSKFVYKKLSEDDPSRRKPDLSLAKKKLDWFPSVDLDKGLIKTISYFQKKLQLEPNKLSIIT